jgi:hypothetical protein
MGIMGWILKVRLFARTISLISKQLIHHHLILKAKMLDKSIASFSYEL